MVFMALYIKYKSYQETRNIKSTLHLQQWINNRCYMILSTTVWTVDNAFCTGLCQNVDGITAAYSWTRKSMNNVLQMFWLTVQSLEGCSPESTWLRGARDERKWASSESVRQRDKQRRKQRKEPLCSSTSVDSWLRLSQRWWPQTLAASQDSDKPPKDPPTFLWTERWLSCCLLELTVCH